MARRITTLNRWEHIASGVWTENKTTRFTKDAHFDDSRWLRSIMVHITGAVTVGVANATALLADNVGAIVQEMRMSGKNLKRGTSDNNFCMIRGADLKELRNIYSGVSIFDNSDTLAVATGTYHLDFYLIYDFPPPKLRVEEQIGYLFDMPNWSDFSLYLQFGDANNLFNPAGTTTFAWANQNIELMGRYAQEPGKFAGFGVGLRYLNYWENTTAQLTANGAKVNLQQLDNKGKIRALLLKTGVVSQTTTGGNVAYASLSNAILSNLRIIEVPNQLFREYDYFNDIKAENSFNYRRSPATGYALIDLVSDGLPFEVISPSKIATGEAKSTNFYLQADVAGAANQGLVVAQESLYYSDQIVIPK